ncbi:hypothetical protein [uncultured Desulfobacter sp.]|nr:hypothetical protein [uncultured Desulfobacter sp.]
MDNFELARAVKALKNYTGVGIHRIWMKTETPDRHYLGQNLH